MTIEGGVFQCSEYSPAMMEALGTPKQRTETAEEFIARVNKESEEYVAKREAKLSWWFKFTRRFT